MGFCVQKLLLILDFHKARAFSFLEEGGVPSQQLPKEAPVFLGSPSRENVLNSVPCVFTVHSFHLIAFTFPP